jgi:hypothetical protein
LNLELRKVITLKRNIQEGETVEYGELLKKDQRTKKRFIDGPLQ